MKARVLRVGLTGGIASGKSAVADEFRKLGCFVLEADKLGHAVLDPEGEAYAPVAAEFGETILGPDGRIDRKRLAGIVFADREKLRRLNAIVHPAVRRLGQAKMAAATQQIVIYEAAILVETGGYKDFDKLIVVSCPEQLQVERAMARDGAEQESVLARIRQQAPLAEKLKYADYVIDTSGSFEQTIEQTRGVYRQLLIDLGNL